MLEYELKHVRDCIAPSRMLSGEGEDPPFANPLMTRQLIDCAMPFPSMNIKLWYISFTPNDPALGNDLKCIEAGREGGICCCCCCSRCDEEEEKDRCRGSNIPESPLGL